MPRRACILCSTGTRGSRLPFHQRHHAAGDAGDNERRPYRCPRSRKHPSKPSRRLCRFTRLQIASRSPSGSSWSSTCPNRLPPADSQVDRYPGLTTPADQMRVFRMAHPASPQAYQEEVNAIRTIPEITKVFPSSRLRQIVVRGDETQIAMAEWLFRRLDQPIAPQGQTRAEQQLHAESLTSPRSGSELRILYFANASSPQARQEIVNAIRTVPELTKVFPVNEQSAVAVRGTADRIALAEWLFALLDRSAPESTAKTSAVYDFGVSPSAVRIFFLAGALTPENYQGNRQHAPHHDPSHTNLSLHQLTRDRFPRDPGATRASRKDSQGHRKAVGLLRAAIAPIAPAPHAPAHPPPNRAFP